ncbi:hypothetical protein AAG570_004240 [Ranatra chinensis]|uniref:Uncharacterized protein n=1 Tax=Ranatra chinensis TaxID=642074 RepID=A0ABD0Y3V5_9HEMI
MASESRNTYEKNSKQETTEIDKLQNGALWIPNSPVLQGSMSTSEDTLLGKTEVRRSSTVYLEVAETPDKLQQQKTTVKRFILGIGDHLDHITGLGGKDIVCEGSRRAGRDLSEGTRRSVG